jgi:hypothetical protein
MSEFNDLSQQDLGRIIARDRFVKDELASRIAALVKENLELMSIIQEIQGDLAALRESQTLLAQANGEVQMEQPPLFVSD